jgi:uncharacterized GH25 family protein
MTLPHRKTLAAAFLLSAAMSLPMAARAHDVWIVPSSTVLSGDTGWVTVDAAVGNDKFYFNHAPLRLDGLQIAGPAGSAVTPENIGRGKLRSTFDVPLAQQGTYRIAVVNDGVFARWKQDGQMKRYMGKPDGLAKAIPAQAQEVEVVQSLGRIETFVTQGKPTPLQPVGNGLELVPVTHPNDLFSGEPATFELRLDGKPAAGHELTVVPAGSRYRDRTGEIVLKTDKDGRVKITWPAPGLYWLHADAQDDKVSVPQASKRRLMYAATLEVLQP